MGTTDEQESASESVLTVHLTAFEHSDVFHHVETMHRQSLSGVGFGIAGSAIQATFWKRWALWTAATISH